MIRHGQTPGNKLKRYIGVTDEGLSYAGIQAIKEKEYPVVDFIYTSPKKRCRETAAIIYQEQECWRLDDLKECDFGDFENKNHYELADNDDYQKWIDSDGLRPFPNGESLEGFGFRCVRGFTEVITNAFAKGYSTIAIVTHGGVIMSIMSQYGEKRTDFYSWLVENGEGYEVKIDKDNWDQEQKIASNTLKTYAKGSVLTKIE